MVTLRQRLDDQMATYVMQSQRETHQDVTSQGRSESQAQSRGAAQH